LKSIVESGISEDR